jgi:hypothetical protein
MSVRRLIAAQQSQPGVVLVDADPSVRGGEFYGPRRPGEMRGRPTSVLSSARSRDERAQERLWKISEELTGVKFPV